MNDYALQEATRTGRYRRTIVVVALAFGAGALFSMLVYLVNDDRLWGTNSYCVVTQESSADRNADAGSFVGTSSDCLPGEIGPICGTTKRDSRNAVISFQSNDCSLLN